MAAFNFEDLSRHVGHHIVCVTYGFSPVVNVALECEDCGEVLLDFNAEEDPDDKPEGE